MSHSFEEILERRFNRRSLLGGAARTIPAAMLMSGATTAQAAAAVSDGNAALKDRKLTFKPIAAATGDTVTVSDGYKSNVVIRWGDPLFTGSAPFDPFNQTAATQVGQFGYNNDWMGYLSLPARRASRPTSNSLLTVCRSSRLAAAPPANGNTSSVPSSTAASP